jgi:cation-transporting ATPase E
LSSWINSAQTLLLSGLTDESDLLSQVPCELTDWWETSMPMDVGIHGLTASEAARRLAAGQGNVVAHRSSRSAWEIVKANVLTRFNAIIGVLLAVGLVFGAPQDSLFGLVIVVNSAVGIVQELRAKRSLDALALLDAVPVTVVRDNAEVSVPPEEVVLGDLVLLGAGVKIAVDGDVTAATGLEVDESLLTGEADPVGKEPGERVLSGSFVTAGSGAYVATAVGRDAYANRLVAQVRRFDLTRSELVAGINRILRGIQWVIVPVGVLLVASQLRSASTLSEAMVGSVAGIVPMIPEGLVLMTSVAFAVGVVRLGRRRCLVQEMPAVEVLARVDTLCVDKTGTLTQPILEVAAIDLVDGHADGHTREALAALVAADPHPNPTLQAIGGYLAAQHVLGPRWAAENVVPFSSARKFSAAVFRGHGGWILGAADVILRPGDPVRGRAEATAGQGLRVLALGRLPDGTAPGERSPDAVTPVALVLLRQRLRENAAQTLRYLAEESVSVKVLSGDNAASVGAIAAALGLPGADHPVDARQLPEEKAALAEALSACSVFGRVTPQQKQTFVDALRSGGHVVAMTGDGVNDALALKNADLGIAMGSGSPATRGTAKIVLLDDDFGTLPHLLAEGRRVLGNIERVAGLFLVKTAYSVVLALLVGVAHVPFPLLPRHVTLIGSLTIGIPGFFLALAPNTERARPGFVRRVLWFAVPAGLACGLATFAAYGLALQTSGSNLPADKTTAALALFIAAASALALVARPYTRWRLLLLLAVIAAFVLCVTVPFLAHFFALTFTSRRDVAYAVGVGALAAVIMLVVDRLLAPTRPSERSRHPWRLDRSASRRASRSPGEDECRGPAEDDCARQEETDDQADDAAAGDEQGTADGAAAGAGAADQERHGGPRRGPRS